MPNGFGQAFTSAFGAGAAAGQAAKRAEAAERARQDQLGFQEREEERVIEDRKIAAQQRARQQALQDEQLNRLRSFRSEVFGAVKAGNTAEILAKYPEQAQQITGIRDLHQNIQGTNARTVGGQLYNALARGDKQGAERIVKTNRDVIAGIGDPSFSADSALELLESDPELLAEQAQSVYELADGDPAKLLGVGQRLSGYEQAQIDIKNSELEIKRQTAALNAKRIQLSQTNDTLKRRKLEAEIAALEKSAEKATQKNQEAKAAQEFTVMNMKDAAQLATKIAKSGSLPAAVIIGPEGYLPTLRGTTQDLINDAERLQSLLTVDNLKLMTGVLTDRDIRLLTNIASGLRVEDEGIYGSVPGVKKRLAEIATKLVDGLRRKGIDVSDIDLPDDPDAPPPPAAPAAPPPATAPAAAPAAPGEVPIDDLVGKYLNGNT